MKAQQESRGELDYERRRIGEAWCVSHKVNEGGEDNRGLVKGQGGDQRVTGKSVSQRLKGNT